MSLRVLEKRIPPPAVALLVGAAMAATRLDGYRLPLDPAWRIALALAPGLAGLALAAAAVLAFRRAGTTVDPVHVERASALVTGGVFGLSRNPMYLGLALVLAGWAFFLGTAGALLGPFVFVAFLTRFQVVPEERLLEARFGEAYRSWRRRVRRWL